MKKNCKSAFIIGLILMSCSCQNNVKPTIVPAVEVKQQVKHSLEVIGVVENVYVLPMKVPFPARIDTGAETSSIDVGKFKTFERDGEKWVSFDLDHNGSGEKLHFEKKIKRRTSIRRINGDEHRVVVNMDIKMGKDIINADFTLADREKFTYQVLIGRNILSGRFIVDPSIENTLP